MKAQYLAILVFLIAPMSLWASAEGEAEAEARQWLELVDDKNYDESWAQASTLFQAKVTKQDWSDAVTSVRGSLGKIVSRNLKSATYATALPGAPDGEYVVLVFETTFDNSRFAVETVTPMKDSGNWRVSGYFIR